VSERGTHARLPVATQTPVGCVHKLYSEESDCVTAVRRPKLEPKRVLVVRQIARRLIVTKYGTVKRSDLMTDGVIITCTKYFRSLILICDSNYWLCVMFLALSH